MTTKVQNARLGSKLRPFAGLSLVCAPMILIGCSGNLTTTSLFGSTSSDASLSSLVISSGTLSPTFASSTTAYTASVNNATSSITVTPTANESHETITVNGLTVTSGSA